MTALALTVAVSAGRRAAADDRDRVIPSWSVIEAHDSNLFFTAGDQETDFITRLNAGVDAEHQTTIWTVAGRGSFDIERFASHPELTTIDARQHAAIDAAYRPSRTLAISAGAELSRTRTPGELNAETGLSFTRARAQRASARSSIARQFGRATAGTIQYSFTQDRLAGVIGQTHAAGTGAERHVTRRDTLRAAYRVQQFHFDYSGVGRSSTLSQTMAAGLTHAITRRSEIAIEGGPRLTRGTVSPDLSASIRHHRDMFDLSLAYGVTETVVIGLAGTAQTESVRAAAAWNLRRGVQIHVAPSYYQSAYGPRRARVYGLAMDVTRPLASGFLVSASVESTSQSGSVFQTVDASIPRQAIAISLVRTSTTRPR